eukprot:6504048-Prymnesium_polylepis.1
MTIHKSQGLTLPRVVIDVGDDERATGQTFVALMRVRHPSHVVFDPMPPKARLTKVMAGKKQLYDRKQHEKLLRSFDETTKRRYASLGPPPSEAGQASKQRSAPPLGVTDRCTGRLKYL